MEQINKELTTIVNVVEDYNHERNEVKEVLYMIDLSIDNETVTYWSIRGYKIVFDAKRKEIIPTVKNPDFFSSLDDINHIIIYFNIAADKARLFAEILNRREDTDSWKALK